MRKNTFNSAKIFIMIIDLIFLNCNGIFAENLSVVNNSEINDIRILDAVESNNVNQFKKIVNLGNANTIENRDNDYLNYSVLLIAIEKGNYEISKILIENNADVNYIPKSVVKVSDNVTSVTPGRMPLQLAAEEGNLKIVELLILKKAAIDGMHKDLLMPPIFLAAHSNRFDIVKYLTLKGADLSNRDLDGRWNGSKYSLIQISILQENVTMLKFLIEHKAPFEIQSGGEQWVMDTTPIRIKEKKKGYNDLLEFVKRDGTEEMIKIIEENINKVN